MDKLKPPNGFDAWLDYAVETWWPEPLSERNKMRAAAQAELDELRKELDDLRVFRGIHMPACGDPPPDSAITYEHTEGVCDDKPE